MFTHKDIEMRTIFVVNCIDKKRILRVSNGELLLEENHENKNATLTKFPFQKILALFVIGHLTVTTPLIEKCKLFGVALIVVKPNLRPVFYWADAAEANYLLRQRQYQFDSKDLSIARVLVRNKINNQMRTLKRVRRKSPIVLQAHAQCQSALDKIDAINNYSQLLGLEGQIAKSYYTAYFNSLGWKARRPRMKCDEINITLDIGYTLLFNFLECFMRMFGFDLYIGVYHRLWFKRKSLVCDIIEPFRCIIDHTVLLAFHRNQFSTSHFERVKHEYQLKREYTSTYYNVFFNVLVAHKSDIFIYVQRYYRCFMGRKSVTTYPVFEF